MLTAQSTLVERVDCAIGMGDVFRSSGQQVTVRVAGAVPVAVKPIVTELPGAMLPLYGSLVTVTLAPDWVNTPFQPLLTCWAPGHVQLAVQPLAAEPPVSLIVTWAWKPPDQELTTEYAHDKAAGGGEDGPEEPYPNDYPVALNSSVPVGSDPLAAGLSATCGTSNIYAPMWIMDTGNYYHTGNAQAGAILKKWVSWAESVTSVNTSTGVICLPGTLTWSGQPSESWTTGTSGSGFLSQVRRG